jgi:hypothetical protein
LSAPIDESARVSRILEYFQDGSYGGLFPDQISMSVLSREKKIVIIKKTQYFASKFKLKKRGKDQEKALLDFEVRVFVNLADFIA